MQSRLAHSIRTGVAALVLTQVIAGCAASTKIISHWQDPQYTGGPLNKIGIFVAAKDETVRRAIEDDAVRNLTGATKGVASYTLYPDQTEINKAGEAAIRARLEQEGIDGSVVIRLQSVKKDTIYVPPQTYVTAPAPMSAPYHSFYGYSGYVYGQTHVAPGYTVAETKYIIETLVYKIPQGNLIWSTTTQTVNPDSSMQLAEDVKWVLSDELTKDGIIAK